MTGLGAGQVAGIVALIAAMAVLAIGIITRPHQ